ncbi:MAG: glycosyl hydrolase 53 family protein [Sedimentisphaerales bacterium]|nr:glycosyl hydrolase 53 family protein [Sedimentisphaerales bacterium]
MTTSIKYAAAGMLLLGTVAVGAAEDGQKRHFRMGFTGFPSDITAEAVKQARQFSRQNADILAHHIEGVPWAQALEGAPFSKEMMEEWAGKKLATPQGAKVYLAVSPGRGELKVADKGPPLPKELNGKGYDDPLVKKAFLNYCRRAVQFFEPDYLGIGIEVNEIFPKGTEAWRAYAELHRYVYDALKKDHPEMPIFASFTLHGMLNAKGAAREKLAGAFEQIMPQNDLVAVSFYPFIAGGTTDIKTSLQWMTDRFDKYGKRYAVVETGEAAERLRFPGSGQVVNGTEEKQAAYYRELLATAEARRFEFVISFLHQDYDAMWERIKSFSPEAFMAWRDCGLLDETGKKRPSYHVWKQYFDMPLENR